jgi:hypothetical protein
MKRARQRRLKPRNPVAVAPILKKGGAHQLRDKRAARARQKVRLRKELSDAE